MENAFQIQDYQSTIHKGGCRDEARALAHQVGVHEGTVMDLLSTTIPKVTTCSQSLRMTLRSHTRSQPRLPPELIDRIIDYLHDIPEDLRTCARVCRAWLVSSRFHLFYTIWLRQTHGQKASMLRNCRRLCGIIQRSPHISMLVRELHFSNAGIKLFDNPIFRKVEKLSPSILQSFTRLRKLGILNLEWVLLAPEIRESLRGLLTLPTLVELEVSWTTLKYLVDLLRPPLKQLTIRTGWYISVTDVLNVEDKERALEESQSCRLESLDFHMPVGDQQSRFIDWLLRTQSVVDLSNLHTLSTSFPLANEQCSPVRLVNSLGSSLEHLTFRHDNDEFRYVDDQVTETINLGFQHKLRTLTITTVHSPRITALFCARVLSGITAPSLERIYFNLRVNSKYWEPDGWLEVNHALDNQAFDSLRSVEVSMVDPSHVGLDAICWEFIHQFPVLNGNGLPEVQTRRAGEYFFTWRVQ